jgi:protocatechuate 3,4-dioxygenase alpha subunit
VTDHPVSRAPARTPPQTTGPFFPVGMLWSPELSTVARPGSPGTPVRLEGRVLDGAGNPLTDVVVELWQADADGRYRHPGDRWGEPDPTGFTGFGRSGIGTDGCFRFDALRPGPVVLTDGREMAPHFVLQVFGRGLLDHLTTRVYLPDDPRNDADPVLALVPADRRRTLLARATGDPTVLRFDVVLQGPDETVFIDA